MYLVCAVLPNARADQVLDALTAAGYHVTRVSSTGGLLRRGNTTLLIGIPREQLEAVVALVCEVCRGVTTGDAKEGGATVFVLQAERFQRA